MNSTETDIVKQQVAAHWGRRAPTFDDGFGHSIRTPAERAAWDRIFALVLEGCEALDALDAGCGTGFLAFELAARGHRVVGVDFAPAMLAEARGKAAERSVSVRFEEADAERLPFEPGSFDLVISRHLLWTLQHPEAAIDDWIRVLRPGGRLVVVDGQFDAGAAPPSPGNARGSRGYSAVGNELPSLEGQSRRQIEAMVAAHALVSMGSEPLVDLVAAQERRTIEEGREPRPRRRYVVWADVARQPSQEA